MAEKVTIEVIDNRLRSLLEMAERNFNDKERRKSEVWKLLEDGVEELLQLRNTYNVPNSELEEMAERLFPKNAVQEWLNA
jgi:hypothetical protein